MGLTWKEILFRLSLSLIFSCIIGIDRKWKNRPAGIRTHALVCVGATIVALIQCQIEVVSLSMAVSDPELAGIVRSDPARLICQVISGIGFLGAGTIIVTKRTVAGLTTAASLWVVACMGLAIGMGYYNIAVPAFLFIMIILILLKKVLRLHVHKRIEIQYTNIKKTRKFIEELFKERDLRADIEEYDISFNGKQCVCTNYVTLKLSGKINYMELVEALSQNPCIIKVKMVTF